MDRAVGKIRDAIRELGIRDDTLLWYCSDNGGLMRESTGGRGKKGDIYEGGLRVPAIIEWPSVVGKPRITQALTNTSDIYPTLLEITGAQVGKEAPLDGMSLLSLIKGENDKGFTRPGGMGFWDHPTGGISTPSAQWMKELLEAQGKGSEPDDPAKLRLDAGVIKGGYPTTSFPGHSAWNDGEWKLHRIEKKGGVAKFELYHLSEDPMEKTDLSEAEGERLKRMKTELEAWLLSVVKSLNGADYPSL